MNYCTCCDDPIGPEAKRGLCEDCLRYERRYKASKGCTMWANEWCACRYPNELNCETYNGGDRDI